MSDATTPPKGADYWQYIGLKDLLELQGGLEGDEGSLSQDEVVFITVHQVYELWLKLLLRDLRVGRGLFASDPVPDDALSGACRILSRIRIILDMAQQHFHLVETITTRDYLEFRDKLFPANGGQSVQFREVEILFGLEESDRLPYIAGKSYQEVMKDADGKDGWAARQVRARLDDKPTLKDAVDSWLYRTPIDGSRPGDEGDDAVVDGYLSSFLEGHAASMQGLVQHVQALAPTEAERSKLGERYAGEAANTAAFLRAEEVAIANCPCSPGLVRCSRASWRSSRPSRSSASATRGWPSASSGAASARAARRASTTSTPSPSSTASSATSGPSARCSCARSIRPT